MVVVAAHPDDEIVSAGILMRRLTEQNARIVFVHVTDGAPRDGRDARAHGFRSVSAYGRARRDELKRAVAAAEVRCAEYVQCGIADQEASTALVPLSRTIAGMLAAEHPDIVMTHPFEGGHPDHDATAFAVHCAIALVAKRVRPPVLVEFASYHLGPTGIRTGTFLEGSGPEGLVLRLTALERNVKERARDCFVSQAKTLACFGLSPERFRPAPQYRFDQRPHPGQLLYEMFDWGLDGQRWMHRATAATAALREAVAGKGVPSL